MSSPRDELRELVDRSVARAMPSVQRLIDEAIAELRDELHEEVKAVHAHISDVHSRAIRELTRQLERRRTQ